MKKENIKYIAYDIGCYLLLIVLVALGIRSLEIFFLPQHAPRAPTEGVLILAAIIAGGIVIVKLVRKQRENEKLREWARANKPEDYGVYPPVVWDEWKKEKKV